MTVSELIQRSLRRSLPEAYLTAHLQDLEEHERPGGLLSSGGSAAGQRPYDSPPPLSLTGGCAITEMKRKKETSHFAPSKLPRGQAGG
jgi:hypothetical protein